MNTIGQLTLEQHRELEIVKEQSRALSLEQAQDYVVEVMRQVIIRDNLIERLLTMSESFVRKQPKARLQASVDLQGADLEDADAHLLQRRAS